MTDLLGYSAAELTSAPVVDFIAEEDRALVSDNIRRRLTGELETVRYRLRLVRRDRSIMHADARGSRAEYKGGPAILGTFLDVTEQKRLEEQLLQSQKMEAIGQLAGGIAHDFNNLLTAIIGNTHLAIDDLPPDHSVLEQLNEINKASSRAMDLVQRILTFSRQEKPRRKPLMLEPVIDEALGLLRATLPATIEIRTKFGRGACAAMADATQVHQIIMNLGTNASHAMDDRGVLEVSVATVEVDADAAELLPELREGRYVRVSISDDGCGMDRATLARIFEPFFTTKPQGQGTVLGLSVVHGIMKNHDGTVSAYSEPGRGTVFHLYFPVSAQEVPAQMPEQRPAARGSGQHVLFVDDEELLVHLASNTLTRLGYRVTAFANSADALAAFRAAPESFDLVVSDLSMPGMTGPELAREMLELRPELPIVIATGYIRQQDEESVRNLGIRALMLKPNTVEEMGPLLSELLSDSAAGRTRE
jgi:PAS domain S-box-containing protein